MDVEQIIEKLKQGYGLEYAPVFVGQCLSRQIGSMLKTIPLTFEEFDAARKDERVIMVGTQHHGHQIFHGIVQQYRRKCVVAGPADINAEGFCQHDQPLWGRCSACGRTDPLDPDTGKSALFGDGEA